MTHVLFVPQSFTTFNILSLYITGNGEDVSSFGDEIKQKKIAYVSFISLKELINGGSLQMTDDSHRQTQD